MTHVGGSWQSELGFKEVENLGSLAGVGKSIGWEAGGILAEGDGGGKAHVHAQDHEKQSTNILH